MYLAVVQNALLMMRFSSGNSRSDYLDKHGHYLEADNPVASLLDTAIFFFGVLQMVSCVIVVCLDALQSGVLSVQERWEQSEGCTFAEVLKRTRKERGFLLKFVLKTPYDLMRDFQLVFYTFAFLMAVMGLLASQFFFAFHLLDMVNKSTDLQNVFKSITLNGRSLVLTGLLGATIIWIYAIIGYQFSGHLHFLDESDNEMCTTLLVCWVSALASGLREGDIGQIMEAKRSTDEAWSFTVLYQFTYYIIVITVLLNVIFGRARSSNLRCLSQRALSSRHPWCFFPLF
jgi:hypothetical protein